LQIFLLIFKAFFLLLGLGLAFEFFLRIDEPPYTSVIGLVLEVFFLVDWHFSGTLGMRLSLELEAPY
jgi:hypothetical protein